MFLIRHFTWFMAQNQVAVSENQPDIGLPNILRSHISTASMCLCTAPLAVIRVVAHSGSCNRSSGIASSDITLPWANMVVVLRVLHIGLQLLNLT